MVKYYIIYNLKHKQWEQLLLNLIIDLILKMCIIFQYSSLLWLEFTDFIVQLL